MGWNSHVLSYCPSFHTLAPPKRRKCVCGALFSMGLRMNDDIRAILTSVKTIAVVGWSPKEDRPSHRVAQFLATKGYRVIPVNPGQAGQDVGLSAPVAASLSDIGEKVEEGLAIGASVIWMQLGIEDARAAALARAQGAKVVMNACPAIEIPRLGL